MERENHKNNENLKISKMKKEWDKIKKIKEQYVKK